MWLNSKLVKEQTLKKIFFNLIKDSRRFNHKKYRYKYVHYCVYGCLCVCVCVFEGMRNVNINALILIVFLVGSSSNF